MNMYVWQDEIYLGLDGEYYTGTYLANIYKPTNITYKKIKDKWNLWGKEIPIHCTYTQLFEGDDSLILCNEMGKDYDYLECDNGSDYNAEGDYYYDIYQYFIINEDLARSLEKHTNEIIYYHRKYDIYLLGVTHCGTSWDYVGAIFTT